jgi:2-C-methyl-D-erythritol 4-phosphate cytidylyltransferase
MNTALIVAGGSGRRMNQPKRKQYLMLAGKPIIAHTVSAFEKCHHIDAILLVIPADDIPMVRQNVLPILGLSKPIQLVAGGKHRQDSVYNGLKAIDPACRIVVIHDGVRPFVSPAQISACILETEKHGACIMGIPAFDTLKKVQGNRFVEKTLDRERIWLTQTPQAFRTELIKKAHLRAQKDNILGTDDAFLVERLGIDVKFIIGSRRNIKITTIEDLELCYALIQNQKD